MNSLKYVLFLLLLHITFLGDAQELRIEPESETAPLGPKFGREAPVFPASIPEVRDDEGTTVATDSISMIVAPHVRELSDSLIRSVSAEALVSPGAPSVVMNRHVESPRSAGVYVPKAPVPIDTANRNWWYLLKHGRLKLEDRSVEWPRWLGWIVGAYNKVNRAINSYDSTYISSTGKNGKIRIISDNWNDQYVIDLDPETTIGLNSKPFYTVGLNLSFLGIGYTYGLDLSNIIGNRPDNHVSHKFGLGTQMFQIDYKYNSSKAGSRVVSLTGVPKHVELGRDFPGVDMRTWSITGYYFFNNKRYSQGAAYSFSKFQKKRAGSLLVGMSHTNSNLYFDFTTLPKDLLPYLENQETLKYRFHYRNTALMMGYAYNLVIHKNLLLNVTVLPGLGFNHCYEDSQEKARNMIAFSSHGGASLAYNLKSFFCGFDVKHDMVLYQTSRYSLMSSVLDFSLSVGHRF